MLSHRTFRGRVLLATTVIAVACWPLAVGAQTIFEDGFDGWPDYDIADDDWSPPGGWTLADGATTSSDTHDGVTHHCGEVKTPGRAGAADRAFRVWRHGSFYYDYCGELHYAEPDLHGTRELYTRWTMQIPADFELAEDGCVMNYLKLWRYIVGDQPGCILANWCSAGAFEIYLNINGGAFSTATLQVGRSSGQTGWETLVEIDRVRDGEWHSYELRIKLNDSGQANGEYQFWLDGVQEAHVTDLALEANADISFSKAALGVGNTGARDCQPQGTFQDEWRAIAFDDYVLSHDYVGPVDGVGGGGAAGGAGGGAVGGGSVGGTDAGGTDAGGTDAGGGGAGAAAAPAPSDDGGCGCELTGRGVGGWWWAAAGLMLLVGRRRRGWSGATGVDRMS